MIIVYGTRSGTSETRLAIPCTSCRQPALVQSDGYQYFHIMFIPTFPVGKHRTIHCEACDSSHETKGSAPLWTFLGSVLFVLCLLGGAARQALRHYSARDSSASITSAETAPSTAASAPASAASTPPKAAQAAPPVAGAHAPAASAKGRAPAASASAAHPHKK